MKDYSYPREARRFVYEAIDGTNLDDILEKLASNYKATREKLERDTVAIIEKLVREGIIEHEKLIET